MTHSVMGFAPNVIAPTGFHGIKNLSLRSAFHSRVQSFRSVIHPRIEPFVPVILSEAKDPQLPALQTTKTGILTMPLLPTGASRQSGPRDLP